MINKYRSKKLIDYTMDKCITATLTLTLYSESYYLSLYVKIYYDTMSIQHCYCHRIISSSLSRPLLVKVTSAACGDKAVDFMFNQPSYCTCL